MICGHYKNRPLENLTKIDLSELKRYLKTTVIEENDISNINSSQIIDMNITTFQLNYDRNFYPICASTEKTPLGKFLVVEKWEYPYWKKNGSVYAWPCPLSIGSCW